MLKYVVRLALLGPGCKSAHLWGLRSWRIVCVAVRAATGAVGVGEGAGSDHLAAGAGGSLQAAVSTQQRLGGGALHHHQLIAAAGCQAL